MLVILGGGSGFIGSAVRRVLLQRGHGVLLVSRSPGKDKITWNQLRDGGLPDCDAVVSLSGENILNPLRRWTESFKKEVVDSRVKTTTALARAITESSNPPKVFVSTSGVGYYAPSLTAEYTEDSQGGDGDFLARLCTDWEASAKLPESLSHVRQVVIRSGVVLGREGGAVQQMIWPFWLGLGGTIGSGSQYFPWIHLEDLAGLFVHALEQPHTPPVLNGVAPTPVTNHAFTKAFGRALGRPTLIPAPGFAIRMAFGSERAVMLLDGQKVLPKRTLESGYTFKYPTIQEALNSITS